VKARRNFSMRDYHPAHTSEPQFFEQITCRKHLVRKHIYFGDVDAAIYLNNELFQHVHNYCDRPIDNLHHFFQVCRDCHCDRIIAGSKDGSRLIVFSQVFVQFVVMNETAVCQFFLREARWNFRLTFSMPTRTTNLLPDIPACLLPF
jgi:hypothetical protein